MALALIAVLSLSSCSFEGYKFNGASIDYTKTKTIEIADFPIRSSYVWGPMGPMFNNQLKDEFANHTKLSQVKRGGDLKIEGEITQVGGCRRTLCPDRVVDNRKRAIYQQRQPQRRLRASVYGQQVLRNHPKPCHRAGGACNADGEGSCRPNIQRHSCQLVIGNHLRIIEMFENDRNVREWSNRLQIINN